MNELQRLEMLTESIKNEIDELQSLLENSDQFLLKAKRNSFQTMLQNIISNLESTNYSIYNVFEEANANNTEEIEKENVLMKEILNDTLSYDEKTYIKFKHNIELY